MPLILDCKSAISLVRPADGFQVSVRTSRSRAFAEHDLLLRRPSSFAVVDIDTVPGLIPKSHEDAT